MIRPDSIDSPEDRALETSALRLTFRWTGDRWAHAIEVGPEGGRRVFAESIEADTDRDRVNDTGPISPTYQDLLFHEDADAKFALLVGQFGSHHYSAEFRLARDGDLRVDVADRTRVDDGPLAATYRIASPPGGLADASSHSARWELDGCGGVVLDCPDCRLAVVEDGRARMMAQVLVKPTPGTATLRLVYSWHVPSPA